MAYSTSNPPVCMSQTIGGTFNLWVYKSTDAPADVDASGYFTDGWDLGMRAGDVVFVIDTDATPIAGQIHLVTSATSTAVDLSDGTAITATDSD
ncbi:MAG: hypothetical protein R3186_04990 [Ruegeria sp.]|nr:hypothetical protein [Ruegeria sp.]